MSPWLLAALAVGAGPELAALAAEPGVRAVALVAHPAADPADWRALARAHPELRLVAVGPGPACPPAPWAHAAVCRLDVWEALGGAAAASFGPRAASRP